MSMINFKLKQEKTVSGFGYLQERPNITYRDVILSYYWIRNNSFTEFMKLNYYKFHILYSVIVIYNALAHTSTHVYTVGIHT